jgi:hypothetical protein
MATKIIFYMITCSGEIEMDIRSLDCWGELHFLGGLPATAKEALKRVKKCQKRTGCQRCDYEIHKCEVKRSRPITFPKNPNNSNSF